MSLAGQPYHQADSFKILVLRFFMISQAHSIRFIFFLFVLAVPVLHAQQEEQAARADVVYLASRALMGRGYLHDGHEKAAAYIRQRFVSIGLDSFPGGYYHSFSMAAVVFPEKPSLRINGVELELGRQFIPASNSTSGDSKGELRGEFIGNGLVVLQEEERSNDYRSAKLPEGIIIINEKLPDYITADTSIPREALSLQRRFTTAIHMGWPAVMVVVDRLTHSVASREISVPMFDVARDAMPDSVMSVSYSISAGLRDLTAHNIVGYIPGVRRSDSFLVVCAHYDHLGAIGDSIYFPGANDNASGVAMMLSLAEHFKKQPPDYSIVFIAFSGEEAGLLGSQFFSEHPLFNLSNVRFLLNMDMVASGREGMMAVGGTVFENEFEMLKNAAGKAGVADVRKRELAPNSDHYPFTKRGVRGFYVYPFTGLQPYHHIDDKPETLEWDVFMRLRSIFLSFLTDLQK